MLNFFFYNFTGSSQCYVTDILKMRMKKFDAENPFFYKLTGFLTQPFYDNCT